MRPFYLPVLFLLVSGFPSFAQDRCGTVEYSQKMNRESNLQFENWLRKKASGIRAGKDLRQQAGPYRIPVVVHIIHNGEAAGTGTNIPDAQVISQINVLNKDFQRLNADASNTPSVFAAVAGSMDIEFVLAKQDPEGLPTTGIVRVKGSKPEWTVNDNYAIKAQSYWPSEDYFNVWVCNLTDYLGYTQFPISDLPGLENGSTNAETDGIVVWYKAFGSASDGAFSLDANYNKGRTLTHEAGHFFGLRHIWGDDGGSCTGTDYVDDTPNQSGSTSGCPAHPRSDNCTTAKMFQNYLDYSNDACMNLFTQGQVSRMITVLENSPRRVSLLTSHGLLDPAPVANDLGLREILEPVSNACSNTITPSIEVKNYGNNAVGNSVIRLLINGNTVETKNFTLNLTQNLQSSVVSFTPVIMSAGTNNVSFEIVSTNGVADGATFNNTLSVTSYVPDVLTVPFSENFNTLPSKWVIQNPDQQITWTLKTASKDIPANKALYMNFFDYEDHFGELDVFLSPVFDLSNSTTAFLIFDVAYAQFNASNDQLKVVVLKNCQTVNEGTVIYNKAGSALATTGTTSQSFTPAGESQWRREFVNMNQFIGQDHLQVAFVAVNDWGNNLYLDNISVTNSIMDDVALLQISSPGPVSCDDTPQPRIVVQNAGTVALKNFTVSYQVNNGPVSSTVIQNLNLAFGQQAEIALPEITFAEGINTVQVTLSQPNGAVDPTSDNNRLQSTFVLDKANDRIPLRQNFDGPYTDWTLINRAGGMNWQEASTNYATSLVFPAFNNATLSDEAWLVSPVLDFSRTALASMAFDISTATRLGREEKLKILASKDCGITYSEISPNIVSASQSHASSWVPATEDDWQQNIVVDLNAYAGESQVRVAFAAVNQNSNNLYIDNIEFFTTDNPSLLAISEVYSIYGYNMSDPSLSQLKITFNLPQRQDEVQYAVVDMLGKTYTAGSLHDILNQTYPLEFDQEVPPGVYVVRLKIGSTYYSNKVLISQ